MRSVILYAIATTAWLVFLNYDNAQLHKRVAVLEHRLAAPTAPVATPVKPATRRSWTSSNGVTFSGSDLDDLEQQNREVEKNAAAVEYFLTHPSSKRK